MAKLVAAAALVLWVVGTIFVLVSVRHNACARRSFALSWPVFALHIRPLYDPAIRLTLPARCLR